MFGKLSFLFFTIHTYEQKERNKCVYSFSYATSTGFVFEIEPCIYVTMIYTGCNNFVIVITLSVI